MSTLQALLWNLLLMLIWASSFGSFNVPTLIVGYLVGFVSLWFAQPVIGHSRYFRKAFQLVELLAVVAWEVFLANVRVARDVVRPRIRARPGVVGVPLDARTPAEITLLTILLTLTPGTLGLDISDDHDILYVHAMDAGDRPALLRRIKHNFERRILELVR